MLFHLRMSPSGGIAESRRDNPRFWSQPTCFRLAEASFSTPEKLFGVSKLACVFGLRLQEAETVIK